MRSILRVGGIAGGAGGLVALLLAPYVALATALVVVAAGAAAGLGAAKWLEHAWYGRQLLAGLRAGVLATGIAGVGALAGLVIRTPHDAAVLARQSSIANLSLAPEVAAFAGAGWLAADLLGVVFAVVVGSLLAAVLAQLTGLEKGVRFVRAVERAREASRPLREEGFAAAALARRTPLPLSGGSVAARLEAAGASAAPGLRTGKAPALAAPAPTSGGRRATGAPRPGGSPAPAAPSVVGRRAVDVPDQRIPAPAGRTVVQVAAADAQASQPAQAPTQAPAPAAKPARKRRSSAKPTAGRLTPEMIEALAAWARETDEEGDNGESGDDEAATATRAPADSTYLNSRTPAKPRKRKKNATRDWIC